MSSEFVPAEFLAATPKERIAICQEMAAEAERSASSANGEARDAYISLARRWSELADEIESTDNSKLFAGRPTGGAG